MKLPLTHLRAEDALERNHIDTDVLLRQRFQIVRRHIVYERVHNHRVVDTVVVSIAVPIHIDSAVEKHPLVEVGVVHHQLQFRVFQQVLKVRERLWTNAIALFAVADSQDYGQVFCS